MQDKCISLTSVAISHSPCMSSLLILNLILLRDMMGKYIQSQKHCFAFYISHLCLVNVSVINMAY